MADALHGFEIGVGVHVRHAALLFASDAVLPRDGAASFDADIQNAHGEVDCALFFAGIVGAIEDDWVEVAVTGVKDICDAKVFCGGHLGYLFENCGKCRARDDAVLHDIVRREAAGRGEGGFAALPY